MPTLVELATDVLSRQHRDNLFRHTSKNTTRQREQERNLLLGYCEQIEAQTNTIIDELNQLNEISIRTGAITVYLMKVKQYANKVTSNVSKLRSLASRLDSTTDDKDTNKISAEIVRLQADNDENKRKMIMYSTLVSAAGGLGADRTYKLLKKQTTKRKR